MTLLPARVVAQCGMFSVPPLPPAPPGYYFHQVHIKIAAIPLRSVH